MLTALVRAALDAAYLTGSMPPARSTDVRAFVQHVSNVALFNLQPCEDDIESVDLRTTIRAC